MPPKEKWEHKIRQKEQALKHPIPIRKTKRTPSFALGPKSKIPQNRKRKFLTPTKEAKHNCKMCCISPLIVIRLIDPFLSFICFTSQLGWIIALLLKRFRHPAPTEKIRKYGLWLKGTSKHVQYLTYYKQVGTFL